MIRTSSFAIIVTLALLAGACQPAPAATPASPGTLRVEGQDSNSLASMPYVLALEDLAGQGYEIEATIYDDTSLAVLALAEGDLDVASPGFLAGWAAVAEGADIVTVLERSSNSWILLARDYVQTCADLEGRSVGVNAATSVTASMLRFYVQQNCPAAEFTQVVVAGTSNRRAALLSGEIDAALLLLDDTLRFEIEAPGQFHVLVSFADELPNLNISGFSVPRSLLAERRAAVKDLVRAMLLERRRYQAPDLLAGKLIEYMGADEETAQATAELFLANGIWSVNGDLSREMIRTNLDFLQEFAGLSAQLQPEDVADWSVLEEVLDEIGRQ